MNFSPIIIFVYNRLHHLDTLFNSLQKNELFKKSKVLVFSDGAKNEIDKDKIDKVRKLLKKRLIPQNSEIIENNVNVGLSRNVIEGLNKIFQIYDRAIILEDDLELSPFFLNYMNDALNLYATSENVASISGYMYPIESKKFSNNYFFLKLIESWGWGTWKRAWNIFENESLQLKKKIDEKQLENEFNFESGISYYKMLTDNIKGLNDSWAIRWYASTFLKNMYTLFPSKSFVKNIGIDNSGENCNYTTVYNSSINAEYNKLKKIDSSELLSDRLVIQSFFKKIKYKRYYDNIINKIKNFVK
jgi:GT2 family glycosyltransferase